eukprot:SAG31_NODE_1579_length_7835_cov_6.779860_3_plen_407_part_00
MACTARKAVSAASHSANVVLHLSAEPTNRACGFAAPVPMSTPLDIRKGLTTATGIHQKLRWGIISASAIASDWVKCLQDVPGAKVTACAAREKARARAFAADHGIPTAHPSYEALCADPNVDIVYIGTKTADHYAHAMMAVSAGKSVLCEKPFTETAAQAREVYAAANAKGLFCQEGMWLRYFPVYEHARAAMELGVIGSVCQVKADYPDRVYALTPAPFAFGTSELPVVAAAGHPDGSHGAVLAYGDRGVANVTFPRGRFEEETVIEGSKGRIKILKPSHHPTKMEIYSGGFFSEVTKDDHGYEGRRDGWSEPAQHGVHVERVTYPLPEPAGERGMPPGSRWDPSLGVIRYKGWAWGHGNMHGFTYQAQAVHRCIAAGLQFCPQFTQEESVHTCEIIDEIVRQLR